MRFRAQEHAVFVFPCTMPMTGTWKHIPPPNFGYFDWKKATGKMEKKLIWAEKSLFLVYCLRQCVCLGGRVCS